MFVFILYIANGCHLHRSHELENLNLTEKQLQDLVDDENESYITIYPNQIHLKRTSELENLTEIID